MQNDTDKPESEPALRSSDLVMLLLEWIKTEIIEDEVAMDNARENRDWDRYHRLNGHKSALVHVKHRIRTLQHNDQALRLGASETHK